MHDSPSDRPCGNTGDAWRWFAGALVSALLTLAIPAQSVVVNFAIEPTQSTGDLEMLGLRSSGGLFVPATQPDTITIPVGGTLDLDVVESGGVVQSVDFLGLTLDYVTTLNFPSDFNFTYLPGIFGTVGTETVRIRLPFDPNLNCGNPVTFFPSLATLEEMDKGTETGTGGDLDLDDPTFEFQATGQFFDDQLPLFPACDGFPFQLGFFPSLDTWSGGPPRMNSLSGTVTTTPGGFEFSGSYSFSGVGGTGSGLRSGQIHSGNIVALPEPGAALGLACGALAVAGLARTKRTKHGSR